MACQTELVTRSAPCRRKAARFCLQFYTHGTEGSGEHDEANGIFVRRRCRGNCVRRAARSSRRRRQWVCRRSCWRTCCRNALRDCGIISPAGCLRCTAPTRLRSKLLLDARPAGVEWLPLAQTAHSSVRVTDFETTRG